MRIVKAEERHLDDIIALERECFSVPWSEKSFRFELQSPDACFIAAEDGSSLLGFAVLHRMCDDGELFNIAVRPEARKSGIGSMLLRDAVRRGKEMGIVRVYLEVRESNAAARKLYEKLGFLNCGVRKNYYDEPTEDAILMVLEMSEEDD